MVGTDSLDDVEDFRFWDASVFFLKNRLWVADMACRSLEKRHGTKFRFRILLEYPKVIIPDLFFEEKQADDMTIRQRPH